MCTGGGGDDLIFLSVGDVYGGMMGRRDEQELQQVNLHNVVIE